MDSEEGSAFFYNGIDTGMEVNAGDFVIWGTCEFGDEGDSSVVDGGYVALFWGREGMSERGGGDLTHAALGMADGLKFLPGLTGV